MDTVRESLQALQSARTYEAPRAEVVIEDASDEEIEAALAEGKGVKTFRKMINAAVANLDKKYDARARKIEETATGSLSGMAAEMAKPKMKHYAKDYIKKEVDAYAQRLSAEQRMNPENYIVVYNAVVGANMDKIVAEELEASKRKDRNLDGAKPGGSSGRTNESPVAPTVKEVFGDEAERELRSRGRSIDSVARAFGMSTEDYLKLARENEGEGAVH